MWTRLVRDYGKKKHLFGVISKTTRSRPPIAARARAARSWGGTVLDDPPRSPISGPRRAALARSFTRGDFRPLRVRMGSAIPSTGEKPRLCYAFPGQTRRLQSSACTRA